MVSWIISRLVVLIFGTLYPAYYSYKAVKSKDIKEYVKWMMYWIIFALFTTAETFTDIFLCWVKERCQRGSGVLACKTLPQLEERPAALQFHFRTPHQFLHGQVASRVSRKLPKLHQTVLDVQNTHVVQFVKLCKMVRQRMKSHLEQTLNQLTLCCQRMKRMAHWIAHPSLKVPPQRTQSLRHRLGALDLVSGKKVPHLLPPKPRVCDEPSSTKIHRMPLFCLKRSTLLYVRGGGVRGMCL
ncbi:receptor expression-enhancing protein 1 isoform X5 [Ahaetulla prasina]|uniref:receptor expression-enhancing protein 1 isoform X5 n=1 Tax=Ahaetulla prasina TaxID=499056 RepID=UPI002647550B|nr:receptor expression-enhancing protein 1 isoform X5 [Ahaetulla prasina]